MKYSISNLQPKKYLNAADAWVVEYKDIEMLMDYIEQKVEKRIILNLGYVMTRPDFDWASLEMYNDKLDLVVSIADLSVVNEFQERGIKFFWQFAATSFFELRGLVDLNPEYIYIDGPLTFDLEKVKKIVGDIKLKMSPNCAFDEYIPRVDGSRGVWVRPEDVDLYGQYIDLFEFKRVSLDQERALLKVYLNQSWEGNLNLLIRNLNFNVDNRTLEGLAEDRIKCGQRCMRTGNCHLCDDHFQFADFCEQFKKDLNK